MDIKEFVNVLNMDLCVGVPDSQLRALCDYLMEHKGIGTSHIITANEGNAVALAAGEYMATGKIPVIYMQNSGIGNAINPILSLIDRDVYGIPCIFVVGWRGETGGNDEPQHLRQGAVTIQLLEDVGIRTCVIGKETTAEEIQKVLGASEELFNGGKSIAFVVRKGALLNENKLVYGNPYNMQREEAIEYIVNAAGKDIIIATTGKAGRELFEIRERLVQPHKYDFLTVGSMGHASSIALGIAAGRSDLRVWCIDGDGAALMHMGAMAVIGNRKPKNLIHVIINNEAHESVGGMPTAARTVDFPMIARGCGYDYAVTVEEREGLWKTLQHVKQAEQLSMVEIKCAVGSREDLGRPTISPKDNLKDFMKNIGII